MRINDNIHLISSTLKTVASENAVTAEELAKEDKPLEEILNAKTKDQESSKQSQRD